MKTTINDLAAVLKEKFSGKTFDPCTRRNKIPSKGWCVVGYAAITKAIKQAGLPYNQFWSGSNPTPSTQAPIEIVVFAQSLCF